MKRAFRPPDYKTDEDRRRAALMLLIEARNRINLAMTLLQSRGSPKKKDTGFHNGQDTFTL